MGAPSALPPALARHGGGGAGLRHDPCHRALHRLAGLGACRARGTSAAAALMREARRAPCNDLHSVLTRPPLRGVGRLVRHQDRCRRPPLRSAARGWPGRPCRPPALAPTGDRGPVPGRRETLGVPCPSLIRAPMLRFVQPSCGWRAAVPGRRASRTCRNARSRARSRAARRSSAMRWNSCWRARRTRRPPAGWACRNGASSPSRRKP